MTACRKDPILPTNTTTITSLTRSDTGKCIPFGMGNKWIYAVYSYDTVSGTPTTIPSTTVHFCHGRTIMNDKEYFDVDGALIRLKDGVYYKHLNSQNEEAPIMIENPSVGDTWQDTTLVDVGGILPLIHTYTITATNQRLTIPAGTFNEVVVLEVKSRGTQTATDEWHYYQDGVGLLKQQINYKHYPKSLLMELQSYSIQ